MNRPTLEVADINRAAGDRFWEHYGSHLAWRSYDALPVWVGWPEQVPMPVFTFPHERAVVTKTFSMRKAGFMYGFFLVTGVGDFSRFRVSEVGGVEGLSSFAGMILVLPSGIGKTR